MTTDVISISTPPELGSMTPEEQAEWRTHHYGNDGFGQRQLGESAKVVGVAAGDSWFDYLPARLTCPGDILDQLNAGSRFNILRTAAAGDTVENMVWGTGYWSEHWTPRDTRQLPKALQFIHDHDAAFFLFSGGGDDIAGTPFADYLNHLGSGAQPLRSSLASLINDYIRAGYKEMIRNVQATKPGLPIILHGYDYPTADGRGVINFPLGFHYLGPWLRPAFATKRIDKAARTAVLKTLIDTFNLMLHSLHDPSQKIYHLDLRNELAKIYNGDYRNAWANELHPTDKGFALIAGAFERQISAALQ